MSAAGFFITGTDTGVGKTVATCGLVRALRSRGIDAGAMKPIETGVGEAGPLDALALQAAAGGGDPLEIVCPLQFAMPAAPNVAAAAEGRRVDLDIVVDAYAELCSGRAVVLVEGAGGLLAPASDEVDMAGLAARLRLPLVLVIRASLGTINHTRLCLEAAQRRHLDVVGVIVSHSTGPLTEADRANLGHLLQQLDDRLIAEIPPLAPGEEADPDLFDIDALMALLR